MNQTQSMLSAESGLLFLVAFVPYIIAIIRGTTKPMKITWIIWATLDSITLYGMWATHSLNFQIVGAVCGAWIVAGLAVVYGESAWTKLDTFCSLGAALGIVLMMLGIPTLGILASVSSVFIASFPTFRSAWNDPTAEDGFAWMVYWLSCYAAVHAIPALTWADAAQPVCFFAIETIMLFLIFVKPWLLHQLAQKRAGANTIVLHEVSIWEI